MQWSFFSIQVLLVYNLKLLLDVHPGQGFGYNLPAKDLKHAMPCLFVGWKVPQQNFDGQKLPLTFGRVVSEQNLFNY